MAVGLAQPRALLLLASVATWQNASLQLCLRRAADGWNVLGDTMGARGNRRADDLLPSGLPSCKGQDGLQWRTIGGVVQERVVNMKNDWSCGDKATGVLAKTLLLDPATAAAVPGRPSPCCSQLQTIHTHNTYTATSSPSHTQGRTWGMPASIPNPATAQHSTLMPSEMHYALKLCAAFISLSSLRATAQAHTQTQADR
jgi:hypothetical protein